MGAVSGLIGTGGGVNGTGISSPGTANGMIGPATSTQQLGQNQGDVQNSLAAQQRLVDALKNMGGLGDQNRALQEQMILNRTLQTGGQDQQAGIDYQGRLMQALEAANGTQNLQNAQQGSQRLANIFGGTQAIQSQQAAQQGINQAIQSQQGEQQGINQAIQSQQAAQQGVNQAAQGYQNLAAGVGPNPAQAMLNQQTGQNVAQQAALMAGQRGAGANVGLLARQAAQQGAATQQQAVGQGATMQAQQQIQGLQGMVGANQASAGIGQNIVGAHQASANIGQNIVGANQASAGIGAGLVGQQQASQGMAAQQAQAQLAAQQAANAQYQNAAQAMTAANQTGINAQTGIANQIAGQQIAGTEGMTAAQLGNLGQQYGAAGSYNNALVSGQNSVNAANAGIAQTQMHGQQGILGGVASGLGAGAQMLGSAAGSLFEAKGGEIPPKNMAAGGPTAPDYAAMAVNPAMPQSSFGRFLLNGSGSSPMESMTQMATDDGSSGLKDSVADIGTSAAKGFNEGQQEAGSNAAKGNLPAEGGMSEMMPNTAMAARGGLAKKGGHVSPKTPAQAPVKKGDSYQNDKVPAMLSAGEIVLPRSVTQSGDPVRASADFVAKVLAKRKTK